MHSKVFCLNFGIEMKKMNEMIEKPNKDTHQNTREMLNDLIKYQSSVKE